MEAVTSYSTALEILKKSGVELATSTIQHFPQNPFLMHFSRKHQRMQLSSIIPTPFAAIFAHGA
jgi:hypothetical protein